MTRDKILLSAKALFSQKGYDGTSVDEIARSAQINKALIYYHFKNKAAIKEELFSQTINEALSLIGETFDTVHMDDDPSVLRKQLTSMVHFLNERREMIKIMVMESIKEDENPPSLFKYVDILLNHDSNGIMKKMKEHHPDQSDSNHRLLIQEFFTGVMPLISFAIWGRQWCTYFGCPPDRLVEYFIDSFVETHMALHVKP